jgi:hypothetical protein
MNLCPPPEALLVTVEPELLDLAEDFLVRLKAELVVLRAPDVPAARVRLFAHRVKGTGAMFGFRWLSRVAAHIEEQLDAGLPLEADLWWILEDYTTAVRIRPLA